MKVLHLISGGDTGGAKTSVLTLLKALIKNKVNAELLCVMEGDFTKEAKSSNIPIKIIPQKRRTSIKEIFKIRDYIKNGNYDIVHCHGGRANYIAFFIKKTLKIPFITTLHSDYKLDFKDTFYKQAIFMPISYITLKTFKHILVVTKNFKKMLVGRGFKKDKIIPIYNGIGFQEPPKIISKEEFFKNYNIPFDEKYTYVGIVARLQIVKGIKYFLEASKKLLKEDKNIIFLIAGSGDLEKEFINFINNNKLAENIKMLGFVNDIYSFYNAIDINILTSLSESFPYSLLEGAKMKKPTIATDVGGISEMFASDTEKVGILIPPKSVDSIYSSIKSLVKDDKLKKDLGESFYKKVYENFSDENMAKEHINIYKRILKEI